MTPTLRAWRCNGNQWLTSGVTAPPPNPGTTWSAKGGRSFLDGTTTPNTTRPVDDLIYPLVKYNDLPGSTFQEKMTRGPSTGYVVDLPGGVYDIVDFNMGSGSYVPYGLYAPNCHGIIYRGADRRDCVVRMKPMSSTKVGDVPNQYDPATGKSTGQTNPLTMIRLSAAGQCTFSNFTIAGTDQPDHPMTGRPHPYNGLSLYSSSDSRVWDMFIAGAGPGEWNSPPWESFQINAYKCNTVHMYGTESTGFNLQRERVGGSPFGGNGAKRTLIEECYLHDSLVSGVTFSFTGSWSDANASNGPYTIRDTLIAENANHRTFLKGTDGQKFTGLNNEGVAGPIVVERVELRHTQPQTYMAINGYTTNADVSIIDPVWNTTSEYGKGCLSVNINEYYPSPPNVGSQLKIPTVVKDGVPFQSRWVNWPASSDRVTATSANSDPKNTVVFISNN